MASNHFKRLKAEFSTSLGFQSKRKLSFVLVPLRKLCVSSLSSCGTITATGKSPYKCSAIREQMLHSLFKRSSTLKDLTQIHAQVIQTGFDQDLFVIGKIITFCAVCEHGPMDYAVSIFEQIKNPDGFLWNTMIRGLGKTSEPEKAFSFYKRMQHKGEIADNFTYSFLLKICGQLRAVGFGKKIHCGIIKHGLDSSIFVRNTLMHMYGMFKDIETARQLFEEIAQLDLVAWNTMIDCYVCCGKCKEALQLFLQMQQSGLQPDEATVVVVLSACSELGALDFGKWVHCHIDNTGLNRILSVSNSLIDMYAKCGVVEEAHRVFNKIKERNIVSWNSIILGLAMNGYANGALELFSKMLELKLYTPDNVTFLGVLCACSHGGLVAEGRRYFDIMTRYYKIPPTIKHYGCMVDLLGRAGLVEEAYELIRSMPMECNAIVWRTLLGACRVHGHVDLGELARKHLLELEPSHSGDYVLLANMYASSGRWNDVLRERRAMRVRRVQKPEPGNSFIGIHCSR